MVEIREERESDREAIREVNRRAFGREEEGRLVDLLRSAGLFAVSLVAVEDGGVKGHILFSHLPIETAGGTIAAVSLAPMAVVPERQGRGIGSALVRRGLDTCRDRGMQAAIVVGHPGYYPRFGFSAEIGRQIESPYAGDAFMALELQEGALQGVEGKVTYPAAFSEV